MARRDGTPVLIDGTTGAATELRPLPLDGQAPGASDEAWLQRLVFGHPSCLPLATIEPGIAPLVPVCREFPTPSGPIDVLLMTPEGDVVIVETKLWRNPEARRRVVVQALDYAACLFRMDYAAFEAAALRTRRAAGSAPASLHALLAPHGADDEAAFVDAVSRNLRLGRIVVLVVGDGICEETERLTDALQAHAGFHFTFALVELAVYRTPDAGLLVLPQTLARTVMIERGVVRVEDGRATVGPAEALRPVGENAGSITAERFFEAMAARDPGLPGRLQAFVARLESIGVYAEFRRSLNLKWDPPSGKAINCGYIRADNGEVCLERACWSVPLPLGHAYVEGLASAWGIGVNQRNPYGHWWVMTSNGKAPAIETVADRLDPWFDAIARFVAVLRADVEA